MPKNYHQTIKMQKEAIQSMPVNLLQDELAKAFSELGGMSGNLGSLITHAAVESLRKSLIREHENKLMGDDVVDSAIEYRREANLKAIKIGLLIETLSIHHDSEMFMKSFKQ